MLTTKVLGKGCDMGACKLALSGVDACRLVRGFATILWVERSGHLLPSGFAREENIALPD